MGFPRLGCLFVPLPLVSIVVAFVAGCASPQPVDPARLADEEARLLQPFEVERTIFADRLDLTLTGNFFPRLALPSVTAGAQEHEHVARADGGAKDTYRNKASDTHLQFEIGSTRFIVFKSATIDVLGGAAEVSIQAEIDGNVDVLEAGVRSKAASIRIADGLFQRR